MNTREELAIPRIVESTDSATEVLRVWLVDDSQHFAIRTAVWDDPAAWGLLLADLSRHVAAAYSEMGGGDESEVLDRVLAGFNAEIQTTTDPL